MAPHGPGRPILSLRVGSSLLLAFVGLLSLGAGRFIAERQATGLPVWPVVLLLVSLMGTGLGCFYLSMLRPLERDLLARMQAEEDQRRYTREIEDLYDRAPCGYLSLDPGGVIVRINGTAQTWLGYRREEILGRSIGDLLTLESRERFLSSLEELRSRETMHDLEVRLTRSDGTILDGLLSSRVVRDAEGRLRLYRFTFIDISERKRSEKRLAEVSSRLHAVLKAATEVAIIAFDLEGRITLFNTGAENMLGYQAAEVLGRPVTACLHLEAEIRARGEGMGLRQGASGFDVVVGRARQGGHEEREWTYVRKDGSHLTVDLVMTGLRIDEADSTVSDLFPADARLTTSNTGATPGSTGFLGIAMDVSERNHARMRLNMTMTAARIGTWDWNVVSDQIAWSENVFALMGATDKRREPSFEGFIELILAEDRPAIWDSVREALDHPEQELLHPLVFRVPGLGDEVEEGVRWLESHGRVFRDADGRAIRMMGTVMDVTDRRRAEEALRSARDAAEEANEAKSRFLASMSHEIRTPLTGIIGMSEILLQTAVTEQQRSYLQTLTRSAESLLGLIDDVLDISKVEAGKLELEAIPFDLRELVADTADVLSAPARSRGLTVRCEIAPELPAVVIGDPGRLRQILLNLLSNAVKFTPSGEVVVRVTIGPVSSSGSRPGLPSRSHQGLIAREAERERGLLAFSVSDTGVGIPRDRLQAIFEPFAQADVSTTRTHGGTGLGLTISARLVERMGGKLTASSTPGAGSTFTFAIPLLPGELSAIADLLPVDSTTDGEPLGSLVSGRSRLRVLLVEDNLVNQQVMTLLLEKEGHLVHLAANGREALEAFEREPFDLVLMDLQMPEMDGLRATRLIRAREKAVGGHVPIIAVTANALQGERQRCLAAGMDEYLPKPIRGSELFPTIDRLLRARTGREEELSPTRSSSGSGSLRSSQQAWLGSLTDMGFDPPAITRLARTFVDTVPGRLAALQQAITEGNASQVYQIAHSLKGSLAVFAAPDATEAAVRLEALGREKQLEQANGRLGELEREIEPLLTSMGDYLAAPPG